MNDFLSSGRSRILSSEMTMLVLRNDPSFSSRVTITDPDGTVYRNSAPDFGITNVWSGQVLSVKADEFISGNWSYSFVNKFPLLGKS